MSRPVIGSCKHDPLVLCSAQDDRDCEGSSGQLFDVFETILIVEAPILSKHIPQLVQFLLCTALLSEVPDPAIQRQACTALDALLEILGDIIKAYLDMLMQTLSGLLDTAPLKVKAVVVGGAIGSAAHASGNTFVPYFEATIRRRAPFLQPMNEGKEVELRGITMDAIGTFYTGGQEQLVPPYLQDMMTQAFVVIETSNARLRECGFFFGVRG